LEGEYDVNAQDWEAARLPSLEAFQVSDFTGAASYSFPIQVPPGPGGLQPSLSLSYSSLTVDSASGATQASWAGMGWSLDVGYIQRSMNGSMTWLDDDTFSINANGVGGMMLKGTDGYYHTTGEAFWRIQYFEAPPEQPGTDYWIAWDKTGNQYYFGYEDADRAHYPNLDPELCATGQDGDPVTWRWALSKVRNIYGQELIFNTKTLPIRSDPCGQDVDYGVDVEMIPTEIIYSNWHYRVVFNTVSDRLDYDTAWDDIHSYTFFQRARLTSIEIQHDPDGDHNFANAETVRRYDLIYATSGEVIFPGYLWQAGGATLTLKEIKEYGLGGAEPLPSTTFTYGDGMHLTAADNGYGGRIEFSYTAWSDVNAGKSATIEQHFVANPGKDNFCVYFNDEGGWNRQGSAYCVTQEPHDHDLGIRGLATKGILPPAMLHPGGAYQLYTQPWTFDITDTASLGLNDGTTDYLSQPLWINHYDYTPITVTMQLPVTAIANSRFLFQCTDCHTNYFRVRWLPTYYRVTEKRIYDGIDAQPSTFTYEYDEPATNDATHSIAVATTVPYWRYTEAYSEFRGHAMTKVIGPDGRVTTTFYHQDDARAGSANTVIVGTQEFSDAFSGSALDPAYWEIGSGSAVITPLRGDTALQILSDPVNDSSVNRQDYTLTHGDAVLVQFQSSGASNESDLGFERGTFQNFDYRRYAVSVHYDDEKGGYVVDAYSCIMDNCTTIARLYTVGEFKRDTWYVLLLIVETDGAFTARIWERDDPSTARWATEPMPCCWAWHFRALTKVEGSLWLDEYSEGPIYTLSDTVYDADSDAPVSADPEALPRSAKSPHPRYNELKITGHARLRTK
jgi:hypothetical protein